MVDHIAGGTDFCMISIIIPSALIICSRMLLCIMQMPAT